MFKKLTILLLITSCVSGLNDNQERKLIAMKSQFPEFYQEEKSSGTGILLGFLPGGGSFYTRHYAIGVVDLFTWPASIFWDPVNGNNGAKEINYYSTISAINRQKKKEMDKLDQEFLEKKVSQDMYVILSRKIEKKYDLDALL